jgi:hypothetical protein
MKTITASFNDTLCNLVENTPDGKYIGVAVAKNRLLSAAVRVAVNLYRYNGMLATVIIDKKSKRTFICSTRCGQPISRMTQLQNPNSFHRLVLSCRSHHMFNRVFEQHLPQEALVDIVLETLTLIYTGQNISVYKQINK